LRIFMPALLPEYEDPNEVPEWQWIEQHASFAYDGNDGKSPGSHSFIMTTDEDWLMNQEIPDLLQPIFKEAKAKSHDFIMFYQ
jgi:hypothetical protein